MTATSGSVVDVPRWPRPPDAPEGNLSQDPEGISPQQTPLGSLPNVPKAHVRGTSYRHQERIGGSGRPKRSPRRACEPA